MTDEETTKQPGQEAGEHLADLTIWASFRLFVGPFLVMFMAGILHRHMWTSFPAWGFPRSAVVAVALTLIAWFFRR